MNAFCPGQAKSGTASLFGLLATNHRAAHEPERAQLLEMILAEARGEVSPRRFRTYLLERARRLDLEFDVAWANQFILPHLVETFPNARFVVLVRDPRSWLESTIGHLLTREIPAEVQGFLDWWFEPDRHSWSRQDRVLQAHGIYPIPAFLTAWNRHVERCTREIPEERRLILRTCDLDRSHARLADFLGIPVGSLDPTRGHLNRSRWSGRLDALVPPDFVDGRIAEICGENFARLFPELAGDGDLARS